MIDKNKKENVIKNFMREHKMSKIELSRKSGVSIYIITKLLNGKRNIKKADLILYKICKATNLSADDILGI